MLNVRKLLLAVVASSLPIAALVALVASPAVIGVTGPRDCVLATGEMPESGMTFEALGTRPPSAAADHAQKVAQALFPAASPAETTAGRFKDDSQPWLGGSREVLAVRLTKADTIGVRPGTPPTQISCTLVFVDAATGEFLFAYQRGDFVSPKP